MFFLCFGLSLGFLGSQNGRIEGNADSLLIEVPRPALALLVGQKVRFVDQNQVQLVTVHLFHVLLEIFRTEQ
uniref:Putative secreted peptide n=1 Tax=Anopheles braziliensis TaxID=58242 RepID=A0A2M3ZTR6_9DIPT